MIKHFGILCWLALTGMMGVSAADDARPGRPPNPGPTPPAPGGAPPARPPFVGTGGGAPATTPRPRPYKEIITDKAVTEKGIFTVHRIDEKVFFEIPTEQLGKDFLWTAEIAKTSQSGGSRGAYGGMAQVDHIICWTKRGDRMLLRLMNHAIRAEKGEAIKIAVESANVAPILMSFDVAAYNDDNNKAAVIDATRLYMSSPSEIGVRAGGADASRSFLETVKAYPTNIEAEVMLTSAGGGGGAVSPVTGRVGGGGVGTSTIVAHYSMVRLPDVPMMGRLDDSRVGFFSVRIQDYGTDEHKVVDRRFITRYRLEKKDPMAAVSEPVRQIVYYISREVPEKWRPAIKRGVEDWQAAFEQAGFKNAIICKEAPSVKVNPDWAPEDARYSVIRWAPTPTANAMGPHVHDPRSGEIISAHIIIWHNILDLQSRWYFSQASPNDPRAQKLPLSDDLMGELIRFVTAHEVGHTLGLQHNMKSSSSISIAQLRDPKWTRENGTASSIMDYARFNYVAQPTDGAGLIGKVGPYDKFAIEWGYKPLGKANCIEEKKELDEIAARQVTNPMYRFGSGSGDDPSAQSEDLGADGVEATRLGMKNIARVAGYLVKATAKFGEDYQDLVDRYNDLWSQRGREIGHVTRIVGGVVETDYHAGRGGANVYSPVPRDRQKAAVALLNEHVFKTPVDMLSPDILNRIQSSGAVGRVLSSQQGVMATLYSDNRLLRMLELESRHPDLAYKVSALMSDLRNGIWTELKQRRPKVDVYRRNLQRAHVNMLVGKLDVKTSQTRSLAVGELRTIGQMARQAKARTADAYTKLHLEDVVMLIDHAMKPNVSISANTQLPLFPGLTENDRFCSQDERFRNPNPDWSDARVPPRRDR